MLPPQSSPVFRPILVTRFSLGQPWPFVFPPALQLVTKPDFLKPNRPKHLMELVTGANPNPNDPQRFLYPITRYQDCAILSGFSFLQCMRRL
jgi:hypothetical protein